MQKQINKAIKSFVAFLLVIVLLLPFCFSASAVPSFPDTSGAKTVYLWNEEYDKVIHSSGKDEVVHPASFTKIMTGLVAIDLIGERLDEELTITGEMLAGTSGTSLELRVGDKLTYRDLLYGAICGGFNDATTALAVASAGNMSAFVDKMNEKAKELGANDTHYTNPIGWYEEGMATTLHDTVIIARAAAKNELYLEVSSESNYRSNNVTVYNRNGLISEFYAIGYHNKRAKGLIAGYTDEGGYSLATTFEYDGLSYLLIIMGATKKDDNILSYSIANDIISHTINYYGELTVAKAGETLHKAPVQLAVSTSDEDYYMLGCSIADDFRIFAPYDNSSLENIEFRPYTFNDELSAPIKKGERIGGVDVFIDGNYCGNAALVASSDVEANGFLTLMASAKKMLVSRAFIVFIIVFSVLFSIYFFTFELKAMRKKDKKIKIDRIF